MDYAQLSADLIKLTPFQNGDDARLALVSCLEVLGSWLPDPLVRSLAAALPRECRHPLELGRAAARDQVATSEAMLPTGQALERLQEICGLLGRSLPADLVRDLMRALPPALALGFDGGGAHAARAPERSAHAPRPSARHLSEARPGSANPLASARPGGAQQQSVAAANPHGQTKLSSARGLTQEREHETLAETSALPPRPTK